jgi:hypothetical protein
LTPAHAAAALPIHRTARRLGLALPMSSLVVGSMTPDFEYLLRMRPRGDLGHSGLGLFVFCLPIGLAVWLVFRGLVAPALIGLLPPGLGSVVEGRRTRAPWPLLVLLAAAGVVLGAASHDLWDSFTHGRGFFVTHVPALQALVLPDLIPRLRWYRLFQHTSTLVGLAVLAASVARWLRHQPRHALRFAPGQAPRSLGWVAALFALATAGAVINGIRGLPQGRVLAAGYAAVGGMSTLAVSLVAFGLIFRSRRVPYEADSGRDRG